MMFNPFANFQQTMQSLFSNFTQTRQLFDQFQSQQPQGMDPQAQVQNMLNNGRMSQEQLNAIMPMAQQMYQMMFGGKK